MTPDKFNALVALLVSTLQAAPDIDSVEQVAFADTEGTEPEIMLNVNGVDLVMVVAPV